MSMPRYIVKLLPLSCLLLGMVMGNPAQAAPFGRSMQAGPFINKNDDYKRLMGVTAGVGKIRTDQDDGILLYANAFMFWFNLSLEYQDYNGRSATNTYTGVGLGRYIQLQYGYGDEGYVARLRSEFEVVGKFTVFIARERYRDKPEFDNYSAGLGYNF